MCSCVGGWVEIKKTHCLSCLSSSGLQLHGPWAYSRVWRVAFASLTHNRLTAVARLSDHRNSLLLVPLLESFFSKSRSSSAEPPRLRCLLLSTQQKRGPNQSKQAVRASRRKSIIFPSHFPCRDVSIKICNIFATSTYFTRPLSLQ
jgi:hypothetical protein